MTTKARRERVTSAPKGQLRLDASAGMTGEAWFANRLQEWHGVPFDEIFGGDSDSAMRKRRIHEAIERHGLEWVICGRDHVERKTLTWGEAYARLYGEKF